MNPLSSLQSDVDAWLRRVEQVRQEVFAECANIADNHAKGGEYGEAACDIADAIRKAAAESDRVSP